MKEGEKNLKFCFEKKAEKKFPDSPKSETIRVSILSLGVWHHIWARLSFLKQQENDVGGFFEMLIRSELEAMLLKLGTIKNGLEPKNLLKHFYHKRKFQPSSNICCYGLFKSLPPLGQNENQLFEQMRSDSFKCLEDFSNYQNRNEGMLDNFLLEDRIHEMTESLENLSKEFSAKEEGLLQKIRIRDDQLRAAKQFIVDQTQEREQDRIEIETLAENLKREEKRNLQIENEMMKLQSEVQVLEERLRTESKHVTDLRGSIQKSQKLIEEKSQEVFHLRIALDRVTSEKENSEKKNFYLAEKIKSLHQAEKQQNQELFSDSLSSESSNSELQETVETLRENLQLRSQLLEQAQEKIVKYEELKEKVSKVFKATQRETEEFENHFQSFDQDHPSLNFLEHSYKFQQIDDRYQLSSRFEQVILCHQLLNRFDEEEEQGDDRNPNSDRLKVDASRNHLSNSLDNIDTRLQLANAFEHFDERLSNTFEHFDGRNQLSFQPFRSINQPTNRFQPINSRNQCASSLGHFEARNKLPNQFKPIDSSSRPDQVTTGQELIELSNKFNCKLLELRSNDLIEESIDSSSIQSEPEEDEIEKLSQLERSFILMTGRGLQLIEKASKLQEDLNAAFEMDAGATQESKDDFMADRKSGGKFRLTDLAVIKEPDVDFTLDFAASSLVDSVLARVRSEGKIRGSSNNLEPFQSLLKPTSESRRTTFGNSKLKVPTSPTTAAATFNEDDDEASETSYLSNASLAPVVSSQIADGFSLTNSKDSDQGSSINFKTDPKQATKSDGVSMNLDSNDFDLVSSHNANSNAKMAPPLSSSKSDGVSLNLDSNDFDQASSVSCSSNVKIVSPCKSDGTSLNLNSNDLDQPSSFSYNNNSKMSPLNSPGKSDGNSIDFEPTSTSSNKMIDPPSTPKKMNGTVCSNADKVFRNQVSSSRQCQSIQLLEMTMKNCEIKESEKASKPSQGKSKIDELSSLESDRGLGSWTKNGSAAQPFASSKTDAKFPSSSSAGKKSMQGSVASKNEKHWNTPNNHKLEMEELERLKFQLILEREAIQDLQDAIRTERLKSLEWMERHNQERDSHRIVQAELEDIKEQLRSIQNQSLRDKDELQQLKSLYKAEQSQSSVLESALAEERQNFRRLKHALDLERTRSREACDRDSDAILDLRNALEVQREIRTQSSTLATPVANSRVSSKRFSSFSVLPSASTGNIPGRFRSLTESFGICNSTEGGLNYRPSAPLGWHGPFDVDEDVESSLVLVDRLQKELDEERNRVDALKSCLEQERQKYDRLAEQMQHQQTQPLPLLTLTPASFFGRPPSNSSSLQDEMLIYQKRRLESLETQKVELNHEVERSRKLIVRLHSEIERLRTQVRIYQNAKSVSIGGTMSYEMFCLRELQDKLELQHQREFELEEKLSVASNLVRKLQEENEATAKRESDFIREMVNDEPISEFTWERRKNSLEEESSRKKSIPIYKVNHLLAVNEAMNDKIKLLENQISRLKDQNRENKPNSKMTIYANGKSPLSSDSGSEKNQVRNSLRSLRLEAQRRALVWQKKYLMLLLSESDNLESRLGNSKFRMSPIKRFRIAALCVVAVKRMEILSEHWRAKKRRANSQDSE